MGDVGEQMEYGIWVKRGRELTAKGDYIKWIVPICLRKEKEHCMRNTAKVNVKLLVGTKGRNGVSEKENNQRNETRERESGKVSGRTSRGKDL